MSKSIPALVKPTLLVWARKSIGMEPAEAASKIGVAEKTLLAWESGEGLSIAKLRKAAEVYKRPLAVFYLPAPPMDFKAMNDFRRLPGVPVSPTSTLLIEMRKIAARREIAEELVEELGETPRAFTLSSDPKVEAASAAAVRVRAALGISVEDQFAWQDDYEALGAWRTAAEALGVLVFQVAGVEIAETRGFSSFSERFPVIVLNNKDAPVARCFTLMHELGHLVLRSGAMCDLLEESRSEHDPEVWCNRFAAEMLMPGDAVRAAAAEFNHRGDWPDESLRILARHFRVSMEAMLRRLVSIERATLAFYQRWRANYRPPAKQASKGGPTVPVKIVANVGVPFLELVLSAYHSDRITASTAASYIDAKMQHVPQIQALLYEKRGVQA